MSGTWDQILECLRKGEIRVSEHEYEELAANGIAVREIVAGALNAKSWKITRLIRKAHPS